MPCYYPIPAYKTGAGGVVFSELRKHGDTLRPIEVPCGQCIGCRLERSRQWAMRCMHEASLHDNNAFVTLTYDDEHLPQRGQLSYPDFQRFMKRLRKSLPQHHQVRYFVAGEYGETTTRPHYHALIFNHDFEDKVKARLLDSGCKLYRSSTLERLWPYGHSSIGDVTFESAAYVARYCLKKVTGKGASDHYQRHDEFGPYQQVPEFCHMSLKPAIGKQWLEKWQRDVYPHDYVVVNGKEVKPPKYYDKLLADTDPDTAEWIKYQRELDAATRQDDNTLERLEVKAQVARSRANHYSKRAL